MTRIKSLTNGLYGNMFSSDEVNNEILFNDFYNNLYEEVITTLFFPPKFVDKTRTVGLSIEKGFEYMDKYLNMFKERGFFQMDAVELPPNFYVNYDRSKTVIRTMIKKEKEQGNI